ncbi:MAG TPA: amidohydrolase family protein [Solirubrobacteraceae bacterium]|nr:amidohydrolase family protein [Solirubrobacteraceae bacterium]
MHQHVWTEPLVDALGARTELPFVRHEHGLTVLHLAGERPYVIDMEAEAPARRSALVELDGLDRALVCLSSPLGIESLPREQSQILIDAYHEGALALGEPFGVWGALALSQPRADDVDRALERGCVGVSLPAGALAGVDAQARLGALLARLEQLHAPLLIHPGPAPGPPHGEPSLCDPLWWPALTRYIAEMHAAWLAFTVSGRRSHPALRVIFSMLAGLAPLHAERLARRGGPDACEPDPLVFYDTASYGGRAIGALAEVVGHSQLVYGSDRPVVELDGVAATHGLDWELLADSSSRALTGVTARAR